MQPKEGRGDPSLGIAVLVPAPARAPSHLSLPIRARQPHNAL